MNKSILFKTAALINFIALFTLFLFYRNGSFDNYLHNNFGNSLTSPNGGTPTKAASDTIDPKKIDQRKLRMFSSKSVRVTDNIFFEKYNDIKHADSSFTPVLDLEKSRRNNSYKSFDPIHADSIVREVRKKLQKNK